MTAQLPAQEYKEYIDDISEISEISQNTAALGSSQLATRPLLPPATETESEIEAIIAQVADFFAELPNNTVWFYNEYKFIFASFGALVATVFALRIIAAVLGAVNSFPLLKEFFELVGIGYTAWFVKDYLKDESNRKELTETIGLIKKDIN
ncbi:hypothetical protein NIES4071_70780 [Calothrix sp. NIES-4071]|nr:hypothetical protein NIES4071_70780 [Calothrix sp. NIES-4071]BAZ61353.1 hypothetical protein NIES4105_70730 [Calothrix sp. NIES-4105]